MKKRIIMSLVVLCAFVRADDLGTKGIDNKIIELKDRITFFNQYLELVEQTNFTSPQSARNESVLLNDDYERIEQDITALRQFIRSQQNAALFESRLTELERLAKQAEDHQRKAMNALAKIIGDDRYAD